VKIEPLRAAIYCRISQTDPSIPKVERQLEMCREMIAALPAPYDVVGTYTDDGISAYGKKNRPRWNALMASLEQDNIQVLVAQAEDRFTRKPEEKLALMLVCQELGIVFHTTQEGMTDPATADGELMSSIRGVVGKWFVSKGRTNLMQSNDLSRDAGEPKRGGVRPFGYEKSKADKKKGIVCKMTIHPVEGPLVMNAYDRIQKGTATLSGLRTEWNNAGHLPPSGKPWTPQKVRQMLSRETNAGIVRHRGKVLPDVKAQWDSLTTKETYAEVMALFASRATGKTVEPKWLCSSLAKCPCEAKMRLATRNKTELSYRCATAETGMGKDRKHTSIGAKMLDALVTEEVIKAVLFGPSDHTPDADTASLRDLHHEMAALRKADTKLLDTYEAGIYTIAELRPRRAQITAEMARVEGDIEHIASHNAKAALLTEAHTALWSGKTASIDAAAKVKETIRDRFENVLTLEQRRALITSMLKITVHPGRGPSRVEVEHLVATGLNADQYADLLGAGDSVDALSQ
jgi:site-specific DNA recombinase